jgi:hypothetical protein
MIKTSKNITLVTGLWDIGREKLSEGWSRSYQHYLDKLEQLLETDVNFVIFGDSELEQFVYQRRQKENTIFIKRSKDWFLKNDYYSKIQKIRTDEIWLQQTGWLRDSSQALLDMYNPIVMSKMFLLNDARIMCNFDPEYMFWIDAGITNTVHPGYFTHDKVLNNLAKYITKFSFICFTYEAETDIHGFNYNRLNELANDTVTSVARGGFFGGPVDTIADINSIYYSLLMSTLDEGYMGTEESIFSIMCHTDADKIIFFRIGINGLVGEFFENLKDDALIAYHNTSKVNNTTNIESIEYKSPSKVGLYVLTFNSPKQFKTLIDSINNYDTNYLLKTKKVLLDNSTDSNTFNEYSELCKQYDFEHIKKDNLGICGGRQFIAEHFDKTDLEYMLFFEDDMFFNIKKDDKCNNGFTTFIPDLFQKSLEIIKKERLDFLKLNFTEFYGDNSKQWAWYNVPQSVRELHWPNQHKLPVQGLDPDSPNTLYTAIKSHEQIPYALGDVYYCNWPQVVSKDGNKKMFLETTWARPYEQTWMSHIFQLTLKKEITSGVLLLTPTSHDRFDHYIKELRKES